MSSASESSSVERIIKSLDREGHQDDQINKHQGSFFDRAPSGEILVARAREYDDIEKHIVRKEYWLKVARDLRDKKGEAVKLLTLPGRYRFEIELYRENGLFGETTLDTELPVVGFETSPEIFGLLQTAQPRLRRLFHDDLIPTLIDPRSKHYDELTTLFPFDIINLDLTNNLVAPSDGPYGPILEAIRACFKLQGAQIHDWALMLTFRAVVEDTSRQAIDRLTTQYQDNIDKYPQVKEACYKRYKSISAIQIMADSPEMALGQFASKWVVDQAHSFDFKLVNTAHLCYSRPRGDSSYSVRKLLFRFRRERVPQYAWPGKDELAWHIDDILTVVEGGKQEDISAKVEALTKSKPEYVRSLQAEVERMKATFDKGRSSE